MNGCTSAVSSFLDPRLADLTHPDSMADRDRAIERIVRAVSDGESIHIFGDYDVDGTTSTAIMTEGLTALGARVTWSVANRFAGGYGLSDQALDRCLAAEPGLLITCDCGSADHPRIRRAQASSVDVVVVDHHLVPEEPIGSHAFINPHRPDCEYPFKHLCSAGLAFSLVAGVRTAMTASRFPARRDHQWDIRSLLDLVALGTVADLVPLVGDNRILTRAGLRWMESKQVRPGLRSLLRMARCVQPITTSDLAFRVTPRLNAAGRLGDPAVTVQLLLSESEWEADSFAARIDELNKRRKELDRAATVEAERQAERAYGPNPSGGLVVSSPRWHRGVVGIVAARLVDRYSVPCLVIAEDDDNAMGHGSGRAPEGFPLHSATQGCAPVLENFGGHQAAVGLTVRSENIDTLRQRFARSCAEQSVEQKGAPPWVDVVLDGDKFPLPTAQDLLKLEPTGMGNEEAIFALRGVTPERSHRLPSGDLKLEIRLGTRRLSAFGFRMGHLLEKSQGRCNIIGSLRPDPWQGVGALQIRLLAIGGDELWGTELTSSHRPPAGEVHP